MYIVNLKEYQFAVGKAEYATGHVFNNNGSLLKFGEDINHMYEVFNNREDAKIFAIEKVNNNSKIECWIIDSKGKCVFAYDQNGERKLAK